MIGRARATRCAALVAVALTMVALAGCGCSGPRPVDPPPADPPPITPHVPDVRTIERLPNPLPQRGDPLAAFFRALRRVETGEPGAHAVVLQIGDSHTASDTWAGRARQLMQGRFGDGGRGYAYPGEPFRWFRQESMNFDEGGEWESTLGVMREWEQPLAFGGLRVTTVEEGAWLERGACPTCQLGQTWAEVRVHYLVVPDGGHFDVLIDGEVVETISTAADPDEPFVELGVYTWSGDESDHIARVEAHGDGPIHITAFDTRSTNAGVVWSAPGMNGARADQWVQFDRDLSLDELAVIEPQLVIAAFGTNEAYGDLYEVTDEQTMDDVEAKLRWYARQFGELIDRIREGAPNASCIAVLSPDFYDTDDEGFCLPVAFDDAELCITLPRPALARVAAVQREVAANQGCAVWDPQLAMGGPGSMSWGVQQDPPLGNDDGVHLTGAGYDLMAELFIDDLMWAYDRYLEGEDATLTTTNRFPEFTVTLRDAGVTVAE